MQRVIYVELLAPLVLGQGTTVRPLNHPDVESVTNGYPCFTTPVQKIYPDGKSFETRNTLYVPIPDFEDDKAVVTDKKVAA